MQWIGWLAAFTFLLSSSILGILLLRRLTSSYLTPLESLVFGPPLGLVVVSLVLLTLAVLLGFTISLIGVVIVATVGVSIWFWRMERSSRTNAKGESDGDSWRRAISTNRGAAIVLCSFFACWAVIYARAYPLDEQGMWARTISLWADWALHLGDTMYLTESPDLPPENPRYPGKPYAYHYLLSFTTATLVKLGVDPFAALPLTGFFLSLFVALSLYAFYRRLSEDGTKATVGLALFLLVGGLGWHLVLLQANSTHQFWGPLFQQPWNVMQQEAANFRFHNMYFSLIHPQRGHLYGLPLSLLVLTLLHEGVTRGTDRRSFVTAGIVAGLLPFAHLSSLLALALITPFLALLFWSRHWLWFFGLWAAVGLPQVLLQQGGVKGGPATLRWQAGWIAAPDSWIWFWIKNLGLFLPILVVAIFQKDLLPGRSRRFVLGFMPIFLVANLVVFQPWDWDNTKVLLYWMIGASLLVAAFFVDAWKSASPRGVRLVLAVAFLTMILSGLLVNLNHLLGREKQFLLSPDELRLGELLRERTDPRAIFAVGLQHNHPVPMLTGRRVLMSYSGWLWSQGIDSSETERDLRAIYRLQYDAPTLMAKHKLDFVVIGPYEINQMNANLSGFRAQYRPFLSVGRYEVFDVRPR